MTIAPNKSKEKANDSQIEAAQKRQKNAANNTRADSVGALGDHNLEISTGLYHKILPNEKVYQGNNNSFIVLGRDRPSDRPNGIPKGYGSLAHDNCGMIDLTVGRLGPDPECGEFPPNPFTDAAKIYMSQKTDIDDDFGIALGKVKNSVGKSGIAVKADAVRLIARDGIKLVTGTDFQNSLGGAADLKLGVDIIANNDDTNLQQMVRGDNMRLALGEIIDVIDQTLEIMASILEAQMNFNTQMGSHIHDTTYFWGTPTSTSGQSISASGTAMTKMMEDGIGQLTFMKSNLAAFVTEYLRETIEINRQRAGQTKDKYICSKYNNVN